MKQYNRVMLGEHGKYLQECIGGEYIGVNFLPALDLSDTDISDDVAWRKEMANKFLAVHADKSVGTARNSVGFLWTLCFGLQKDDVVIASNGEGSYRVGIICGDYYHVPESHLPHRRKVQWLDKLISRKSMSVKLQNSTGSIGTCCNITKYSHELEALIQGVPMAKESEEESAQPAASVEKYKERTLHRLLANYLSEKEDILSKTIFHETSNKSDQNQKWIHPDMVGVRFNEFRETATVDLLKTADIKQYVDLYSFELKRTIDSDHRLKEYFFQALSNSSWANYGYLVAFEINDELTEEMERLNRAFGIGIILLSPFSGDTKVLYSARKNDVDYYTVDKLCRINADFKEFVERCARVLNAGTKMMEDVKAGLRNFCDKRFSSEKELIDYCTEHHIPLSN